MQYIDKSELAQEPVLPLAPIDTNFHEYVTKEEVDSETGLVKPVESLEVKKECQGRLITSLEELRTYAEECKGKEIAVDTETTGVCYRDDYIVGVSIAYDKYYSGIYIPIRHQIKQKVEKEEPLLDENGVQLKTKAGKLRVKKVKTFNYIDSPYNLPAKEVLDLVYQIMVDADCVFMHNSEFDLNMFKKEGYDVMKINTFDTIILPYLYDSEGKNTNGLKFLERRLLGRVVPEFKDALGGETNFQYTDPTQSYSYACYDVTGTFGVREELTPLVEKLLERYQNVIKIDGVKYNVMKADNNLIRSFVDYYNHAVLQVDKQVAIDYKEKIMADLASAKEMIFGYFGKPFNLSKSSKEFQAVMKEFNINTGATTDTGRISFGDEGLKAIGIALKELKDIVENHQLELEFLNNKLAKNNLYSKRLCDLIETYGSDYFKYTKGTNFGTIYDKNGNALTRTDFLNTLKEMLAGETKKKEILEAIKNYGSLMKALNSYIDKLTQVDSCRMRYRLYSTASGRLSSGNSERSSTVHNNYYIDLNAQNLTKPHSCLYKAEESDEYGNIMGYKFTEVSKEYAEEHPDELIVEGAVQTANIRKCIVAPSGVYKVYVQDENGPLTKKFFRVKLKDGKTFEHVAKCRIGINPDKSIPITPDMVESVEPLGEKKCKEVIVDRFKYLEGYDYIFDEQLQESRYVLSCDYSSEEYIALATLSRDHVMLENFKNGVDPHTASAWAIYGKENYSKEKRKKAKAFNFANNYGGTKYAIAQLLEISPEEAEQMVENYNKTFWQCDAWKKNEIDKAYNKYKGCAYNVFGRPRQFVSRIRTMGNIRNNGDVSLEEIRERDRMSNSIKASIDRRIISHIIQSSCGDICRLDLLKLYALFFKKRDPHIDFLTTVHDEINFSVDKSKIIEYARIVEDTMLFPYFDSTLPIRVTIGIGDSLGNVFDFVWTDETRTKLVPKHF